MTATERALRGEGGLRKQSRANSTVVGHRHMPRCPAHHTCSFVLSFFPSFFFASDGSRSMRASSDTRRDAGPSRRDDDPHRSDKDPRTHYLRICRPQSLSSLPSPPFDFPKMPRTACGCVDPSSSCCCALHPHKNRQGAGRMGWMPEGGLAYQPIFSAVPHTGHTITHRDGADGEASQAGTRSGVAAPSAEAKAGRARERGKRRRRARASKS